MDPSEAEKRLERLLGYLKQDPENLNLLVDAAELAWQLGRGSVALEWLDQALLARPGEPRLLSCKGNALLALGQLDQAAEIFESLIEQQGRHPVLIFNLAQARQYQGRSNEALNLLDSVPEEARASVPEFDLSYGRAAYQLQRYEVALQAVENFLATHPGYPEALGIRAMVLFDMGREDEAVALSRTLLLQPGAQWAPHLVMGSAALSSQDAAAAETHFGKVVEAIPNAGRAWSGLGFAAMMRRDLPAARERFQQAVTQMRDHPGTWHGLAWTCILMGDLAKAREAIDHSMQADRNFADNHGTLAVLEVLQGRRTEAELSIRKALRLNPAAPSALYARSLLLDTGGDRAAADATVERILSTMQGPRGVSLLKLYQESRKRGGSIIPPRPPSRLH